ncbi:MAG: hypothetical protein AAFY91_14885, partial [Bacteroidota bacterium]
MLASLKLQFLVVGLLLSSLFANFYGQAELFTNRLEGAPIAAMTMLSITDDKADLGTTYPGINNPFYVHNRLVWNLSPNSAGVIPAGEYRMLVDIDYWLVGDDVNAAAPNNQLSEIIVNVDSNYIGRPQGFLSFGGAVKLDVEVSTISLDGTPVGSNSPEMELIGEIAIDRNLCDLDVQEDLPPAVVQNIIQTDGSFLGVYIDPMVCADEYDLEWTFYDEDSEIGMAIATGGDPSISLNDLFRHNASRMTSSGTLFRLFSLYREGYLLVRWRAVQYDGNRRTFTRWSSHNETLGTGYFQVGHDVERNWQATTNFAEDAKQLPSITFMDGTLRGRQNLVLQYYNEAAASVPADEYAVAQQTIYDGMGRPSITTLPAPLARNLDVSGNPTVHPLSFDPEKLARQPDNLGVYGPEEVELGSCSVLPLAFGDGAGAGRYYSPNNAQLQRNAFVPDAEGYPFSATRYTSDNTGRIQRQGGVGLQLQVDSAHDTRYYYGKPNQWELDRLFGVNVGWARHYEKHMVIDPNGQSSVSYLDSKGRVIATALAGPDPSALEPLPSLIELEANRPTLDLEILDNVEQDDGSLITTYTLLVPSPTQYNICYGLSSTPACVDCPNDFSFCSDCKYEVTVGISPVDNCSKLSGTDFVNPREVSYTEVSFISNSGDCYTN